MSLWFLGTGRSYILLFRVDLKSTASYFSVAPFSKYVDKVIYTLWWEWMSFLSYKLWRKQCIKPYFGEAMIVCVLLNIPRESREMEYAKRVVWTISMAISISISYIIISIVKMCHHSCSSSRRRKLQTEYGHHASLQSVSAWYSKDFGLGITSRLQSLIFKRVSDSKSAELSNWKNTFKYRCTKDSIFFVHWHRF